MATAINDFIQGIIMIVGIVDRDCRGAQGARRVSGSAGQRWQRSLTRRYPTRRGCLPLSLARIPLGLLGVVLLTSLGTWGLPQMVQKFYAIKQREGH